MASWPSRPLRAASTPLGRVLGALPPGFPVPVVVVQHLDPRHRTVIAEVLGRRAKLPVELASQGERAEPGTIYIAPPDHHLLLGEDGTLTLSGSELVHFVRPSADLLFESVAGSYGPRAIACVLTGTGSDGAMGAADYILPLDEIASVICGLVEART